MRANLFNIALAVVLVSAGAVFLVSYGWALGQVAHVFGLWALAVVAVSHFIVWLGVAALFDKRHPPERR